MCVFVCVDVLFGPKLSENHHLTWISSRSPVKKSSQRSHNKELFMKNRPRVLFNAQMECYHCHCYCFVSHEAFATIKDMTH